MRKDPCRFLRQKTIVRDGILPNFNVRIVTAQLEKPFFIDGKKTTGMLRWKNDS